MKDPDCLGCCIFELDPGDEFSFDGGITWVIVKTIVDAKDNNDVIIKYQKDDGEIDTLRCDYMSHVLLNKNYKG